MTLSNYPNVLDTLSNLPDNKADGTVTATDHALHHNTLADCVIAVETVLGTNPDNGFGTVAAAIAGKVNKAPTSNNVILGVGDIVGLVVKATAAQSASNVFEMRLNNNALGAYIDPSGGLSAQSFKVAGTPLAASHLSNGTSGSGAIVLASALSAYATLASPALSGTPTAPTAAADTNTTQIATTGFVLGQSSGSSPLMDGAVSAGTATRWSRSDHVHPSDTSRLALSGGTLTGLLIVASAGIRFSDGTTITTASGVAPSVRVTPNATQTLAADTPTVVVFGAEDWDTDGWHDNVANNSRITPTKAGKIRLTANIAFPNPGEAGNWEVWIRKNGFSLIAGGGSSGAGTQGPWATTTIEDNCNGAGDYYEVLAYQVRATSGGAWQLDNNGTHFSATYIRP